MHTDIYHLNLKAIMEGHLCMAQAAIKQVGIVGVAMTWVLFLETTLELSLFSGFCMVDSVGSAAGPWCVCIISSIIHFLILGKHPGQAIAVHTFCVLVLHWSTPNYISKLVVLIIWIFTTLVIGIPNIINMNKQYYGNMGYCKWCSFLDFFFWQITCFPLKGAG